MPLTVNQRKYRKKKKEIKEKEKIGLEAYQEATKILGLKEKEVDGLKETINTIKKESDFYKTKHDELARKFKSSNQGKREAELNRQINKLEAENKKLKE